MPCVLNAANEISVAAFLSDKIRFLDIANVNEAMMTQFAGVVGDDLDTLLTLDAEVRKSTEEYIQNLK